MANIGDKEIIKEIEEQQEDMEQHNIKDVVIKSFKESQKISLIIISLYIPLSIITILLKQAGYLEYIAPVFSPIMVLMGLPAESGITIITGFLNLFGGLATMNAFELTSRQITIFGVVLGISHGLFVETGILMKLKMATFRIMFFRIAMSIIAGILMNIFLPADVSGVKMNPFFNTTEFSWISTFQSLAVTSLQIIIVLFTVTLLYRLVAMWKHSGKLRRKFAFMPKIVGLSEKSFVPWIVGFMIGIGYGAGILFQFMKKHTIPHKDICLITVFLILAHGIIEDTLLFVIIGGNFWWIFLTRIFTAFFVVRLLAFKDIYRKFLWIGLPKDKENKK